MFAHSGAGCQGARPRQENGDVCRVELNLGACHYSPDDHAVLIAQSSEQVGWLPACDAHRRRAGEGGYEVAEQDEALDAGPMELHQ
jgi:hypothetical protein